MAASTPLDIAAARHYVAFAAGSGITPVLSLIRTTLAREPRSRFTLVYGNRSVDSIIFSEALEDLEEHSICPVSRCTTCCPASRRRWTCCTAGSDRARVAAFLETLIPVDDIDAAFVCGPASMIDDVEAALKAAGLDPHQIHAERFGVPLAAAPRKTSTEHHASHAGTAELGGRAGRQAAQDAPAAGRRQCAGHRAGGRAGPALRLQGRGLLHLPRQGARRQGRDGEELHAGAVGDGKAASCSPARRARSRPGWWSATTNASCCWWHDSCRDYNGGTRSMRRIVRQCASADGGTDGGRGSSGHVAPYTITVMQYIRCRQRRCCRATRCARPWPRRPVPTRWSSCATTWPSAPSRMWTAPA